MNLIGFFCLAWALLACGQDEGKDNPGVSFPDYGEVLAFPGAEGYGRHATGGRTGEVYQVTTLADSGRGSLRDAVSKPNRIIVFKVAGVIKLESPLDFSKNLTIAAQTAPGDGVVVYGNRVSFSGADNLICRYLRVRMGMNGREGKDAAGIAYGSDMIFDHMSVTWGRDECFSINGDPKKPADQPRNITIQNSFIGQGLQPHSCGGLIQTTINDGVTLYRNLYIDNKTRNPKVKGLNQFVNNVLYNWGNGGAYIMGDTQQKSDADIRNNYFIVGTTDNYDGKKLGATAPFTRYNEHFSAYLSGNFYDDNKDGLLNGRELGRADCMKKSVVAGEEIITSPTFLERPSDVHPEIKELMTAQEAYEWIVANGGSSLPVRDEVDAYLIDELTSLGKKGLIIHSEEDIPTKGPGNIKSAEAPADTDNDGMPDEFEDKYGLDKNDPADAMKVASNGYTNIENYIFLINMNFVFDEDNQSYFRRLYEETLKNEGWKAVNALNWHMIYRNKRLDDNGPMGASLIDLSRKHPNAAFRKYIESTNHHLMFSEPRLADGTIARLWPHVNTVWADDAFMALSFLVRMGEMTGDNKYFDDAANQVLNYTRYLWCPEKEVYYHCYHTDTKIHGVAHWSRANGWVFMATADLLSRMPENHPMREDVIKNFRMQTDGVIRYQGANGLWHQLLDKPDSYEEITGTAMFVFGIAKGVKEGWLHPDYIYVAWEGLKGMLTKITPEGDVTAICAGTGIMPSLSFYYNRPQWKNDPMGEGPVLRALVEMIDAPAYTEIKAEQQYDKIKEVVSKR